VLGEMALGTGRSESVTTARSVALALLVGPEGGWDESEIALAEQAGCTAVRLGPRVLRTETAGLAALAALQCLAGDFA
jgi:16S rRNA (uracil1498-N3)-methyltransferase